MYACICVLSDEVVRVLLFGAFIHINLLNLYIKNDYSLIINMIVMRKKILKHNIYFKWQCNPNALRSFPTKPKSLKFLNTYSYDTNVHKEL